MQAWSYKIFVFAVLIALLSSCLRKEPILSQNQSDFELKRDAFEPIFPKYFEKLDTENLTEPEREYLEYLITYMPLSDFADYTFEFWLQQVQYSILAKETFAWSDSIPEDVFLHYVLPPRVNNENLDTARMVFYRELKERLLGNNYSILEAVLEVNHWCNEKVIYTGTDERTISPLGIVRSGFGRCGEESTFLVTALRSVGIPARQVYTPRWVHTDDNHAWVEVWVNDQWNYIGACEPSPVLNTGWFGVPATRAMLVHTKQFGKETQNNSNVLSRTLNFDWINTLSTYAPVKKLVVRVVDENNLPVNGAIVKYQVYNYAELYPLYKDNTSWSGFSEFTTGYGSLEVFVSNGTKCCSQIVKPEQNGLITIVLGDRNVFPEELCVCNPPVAGAVVVPNPDQVQKTNKRIKVNDRIRKESQKTFYNQYTAEHFADTFGYNEDIVSFLIKSRGNWPEIEKFLIEASYMSNQFYALKLLEQISEKDLRDTRSDILTEHLNLGIKSRNFDLSDDVFYNYVLNPRIEFEMLKSYRKDIINSVDEKKLSELLLNPNEIAYFIRNSISTEIEYDETTYSAKDFNQYNVALTPSAVNTYKIADEKSLKIYFVAFCRSLGIPSRIDFASGLAQYYHNDIWYDAILQDSREELTRGKVYFVSKDSLRDFKYRINFSLAIFEKGQFSTIDLGWDKSISSLSEGVDVPIGEYMLLSSLRLGDGSVIVNREYFDLAKNEILYLEVNTPEKESVEALQQQFKHGEIINSNGVGINSKSLFAGNEYLVMIWLQKNSEPSKHILQDLNLMYEELNRNGISVVYLTDGSWKPDELSTKGVEFYKDIEFDVLYDNLTCKVAGSGDGFPHILMIDKNGKLVYNPSGYIINLGDLLLQRVD